MNKHDEKLEKQRVDKAIAEATAPLRAKLKVAVEALGKADTTINYFWYLFDVDDIDAASTELEIAYLEDNIDKSEQGCVGDVKAMSYMVNRGKLAIEQTLQEIGEVE